MRRKIQCIIVNNKHVGLYFFFIYKNSCYLRRIQIKARCILYTFEYSNENHVQNFTPLRQHPTLHVVGLFFVITLPITLN